MPTYLGIIIWKKTFRAEASPMQEGKEEVEAVRVFSSISGGFIPIMTLHILRPSFSMLVYVFQGKWIFFFRTEKMILQCTYK